MAVYSNSDITQAIGDGTIVCTPFNPHHISEASLDFTLGYYYYRQEAVNNARVYNPFSKQDVERYFNGPHTATPHQQWCQQNGYALLHNIPPSTLSLCYAQVSASWRIRTSLWGFVPMVAPPKSKAVAAGAAMAWQSVLMLAGSTLAILTALRSKSITSTGTKAWYYRLASVLASSYSTRPIAQSRVITPLAGVASVANIKPPAT